MANPLRVFTIADCGLEIEIEEQDSFHRSSFSEGSESGKRSQEYTLKRPSQFRFTDPSNQDKKFQGYLSPKHKVTLPPFVKEKGAIPQNAKSYSFMYPPEGLGELLDWEHCILESPSTNGVECTALLGGFVYFDANNKIIRINALSLKETEHKLNLSGPFKAPEETCNELIRLKRLSCFPLGIFHEAGFVTYAWVRPNEMFESKPATEEHHHNHGAFVIFREDDTAVTYTISGDLEINPMGDVEIIADVYQKCGELNFFKTLNQTSFMTMKRLDEKRQLMAKHENLIKMQLDPGTNESVPIFIESERKYDWTPLHYACRFRSRDHNLIKNILEKDSEAASMKDEYGRHPLHIAVDSGASADVVKLLLGANQAVGNFRTEHLRWLPLHIVLFRGCHDTIENVVKELLDADKEGLNIHARTAIGRLPLHIAIEKKVPTEVIKLLLPNETVYANRSPLTNLTLYHKFNGKLPIHIACWNNSSVETVKVLLESETERPTIDEDIDAIAWLTPNNTQNKTQNDNCYDDPDIVPVQQPSCDYDRRSSNVMSARRRFGSMVGILDSSLNESTRELQILRFTLSDEEMGMNIDTSRTIDSEDSNNPILKMQKMTPLTLCLCHSDDNSYEVAKCLLRQVRTWCDTIPSISRRILNHSAAFLHGNRNILHIACKNKAKPDIIRSILDIDGGEAIVGHEDEQGYSPLHYACEHGQSKAVIQMLLDAEKAGNPKEEFPRKVFKDLSPLCLAIRSEASLDVIDLLVQPQYFNTCGLDNVTLSMFAERVKSNLSLQERIIEKMAERLSMAFLTMELFLNVLATTAFLRSVEAIINMEIEIHDLWEIDFCAPMFAIFEAIQLVSQKEQYLLDPWNYYKVILIAFMVASRVIIRTYCQKRSDHNHEKIPEGGMRIITLCGIMLIGNGIFYLRQTFLPFAKLLQGVRNILFTLIPFFVASILVLLGFTLALRVEATFPKDDVAKNEALQNNEAESESCACGDSFAMCFNLVVSAFFSGGEDLLNLTCQDTKTIATLLNWAFGFFALVVLLNVVIAIVNNSWGDSGDEASYLFWLSRIRFLNELTILKRIQNGMISKHFASFAEAIDNVKKPLFTDNISWSKDEPYNKVSDLERYKNPKHYFADEIAEKILAGHSMQSDLYWARRQSNKPTQPWTPTTKIEDLSMSRTALAIQNIGIMISTRTAIALEGRRMNGTALAFQMIGIIIRWFLKRAIYYAFILLGAVTFGVFWPKNFRIFLMGINYSKKYKKYEAMQNKSYPVDDANSELNTSSQQKKQT